MLESKSLRMTEKTGNGHHQAELEQFLEDLKAVVRDGQQLLRAGVGTAREQARLGAEKAGQLARDRPYQTLGVAFGAGLLAGLIFSAMLGGGSEAEED